MAKKEVYDCQIWGTRKGQIKGFNGMCVIDAVKNSQTPCIHFMGKTKLKVKIADVPKECFVARIARKLPLIGQTTS